MPSPASPAPSDTESPFNVRERIIVALDVPSADEARSVVAELGDAVGAFKIGMQLFTAAGPDFVRELTGRGVRVFLDLKYHDIPNTVASAGVAASGMGVWMFNVHASGGREMMRRTVDAVDEYCEREQAKRPLVIGVTVLTSSNEQTLADTGVAAMMSGQVARLAKLAFDAGLDGVVASPREVSIVRESVDDKAFLTVTPGIRGRDATSDDQRRVSTIGEALAGGSDFVVVGRPILGAKDRLAAVESLVEEAAQPK
ncbi:MAG: orotidine-5'-phosphate decarboxylase [Pyrinomonadaceae bacterium]